jgi:predicted AlkP superfamily pyrophosphatase or phosphodiesterase
LLHPTAVINVVGLTGSMLGADTPNLNLLAADGSSAALRTITPAVTCAVQATFVTGTMPRDHGVVGNGWYVRDLAQVMFWRQANQLMAGEKVWDTARRRDRSVTCAKMFWWFNMYSSADWSVTPETHLSGRRPEDSGHLLTPRGSWRDSIDRRSGAVSLLQLLGPTDLRS